MVSTLFRSGRMRVATLLIACLWLLQPLLTEPPRAATGPATSPEGEQTLVAVLAADAAGHTTALADGFFVKGDVVATSYEAVKGVKDVASLRIKFAGRDHLEAVSRVAAFDESLGIALLALNASVGLPYAIVAKEQVTVGERVDLPARTNTGAARKPFLIGVANIHDRCYLIISPRVTNTHGGPVFNSDGTLIGIVARPLESNELMNYAVHVSYLADLMARMDRPGSTRADKAEASGRSGNCLDDVVRNNGAAVPPPPPPPPMPGENISPPKIIRKNGGVLQGSAIKRVEPEYPRDAIAAGVSGAVVVEVTVDEEGFVIAARAISGHALLRDAAVEAARQWRFTPTRLSGYPVKVIGTITFNFNL